MANKVFSKPCASYTSLDAARIWLKRGAALLPVQPGSKKLVRGFGHNNSILTEQEAARWFGPTSLYNLAILTGPDLLALDFDNNQLFVEWSNQLPSRLISYEETSAHGWHVFYRCNLPAGIKLVPGAEIKRICLVSPSQVDGRLYQVVDRAAPLVEVTDWQDICSSLLLSKKELADQVTEPGYKKPGLSRSGADLISKIKSSIPILNLASSFTQLKPSGGKGYFLGQCPLPGHSDHNPSFWVDTIGGRWGCFGCNSYGDVINLYAKLNQLTTKQAIQALARELVQ